MSGPFTFFGLSVKQAWTSQRVGGQTRHKQVPCVAHHDDGDKDDEDDDYNEDNDNEGIRMRMSLDETQTGAASRQVAIHCR